jgi:hypothetical protein
MKQRSDLGPMLLAIALLAALLAFLPYAQRVHIALRMYTQDYDNRLPPIRDTVAGQRVLAPYLEHLRR